MEFAVQKGGFKHTPVFFQNFDSMTQMIYGSLFNTFVMLFETHHEIIREKFGQEREKWPEIINFARIIRNAASYHFKVNFNKPTSLTGT